MSGPDVAPIALCINDWKLGSNRDFRKFRAFSVFDKQDPTFALFSVASNTLSSCAQHLRSRELPAALYFAAALQLHLFDVFSERQ
jgi:hypothetical protein